jgi:hypothetical protein
MPSRPSRRAIEPFSSLPRHRRRSKVIQLQARMLRHAGYTGSVLFDSHHLLIDPDEPERIHEWVDIVFPGMDRFTLWKAEFITTQLAKRDLARHQAHEQITARLAQADLEYESGWTTKLIPRKRPGEMRMYSVEFAPEKRYEVLNGQTYRAACDALEEQLMQSLPTPPESFKIDRGYAYGIGLHAVVNVTTLDAAAIEQTIARFCALGERDWEAAPLRL